MEHLDDPRSRHFPSFAARSAFAANVLQNSQPIICKHPCPRPGFSHRRWMPLDTYAAHSPVVTRLGFCQRRLGLAMAFYSLRRWQMLHVFFSKHPM